MGWFLEKQSNDVMPETYRAVRKKNDENRFSSVVLSSSYGVVCEGYWPSKPSYQPEIILSGICLYTACWSVQLAAANGKTAPPRASSLALPGDMERLFQRIERGRAINYVEVPFSPGPYHYQLLKWQADAMGRFSNIKEIRYDIPRYNYHNYISSFESAVGRTLPRLHEEVEVFIAKLKRMMSKIWPRELLAKVVFFEPTTEVHGDIPSSKDVDLFMYTDSIGSEKILGVEDLPQLSIAYQLAKTTDQVIPCLVTVLELPHPFMVRNNGSTYESRMFSLDEL